MPLTDIRQHIHAIRQTLPASVRLVCVSKFQSIDAIREAYEAGERDFGESRVPELLTKYEALPKDIRWHFIGHLQTNKVRAIVPFVYLIHSVDSVHLLETISKEAARIGRSVPVLLEVHTAAEETKTGFRPEEIRKGLAGLTSLAGFVQLTQPAQPAKPAKPAQPVLGLMTMATNTDDETEIRRCFRLLQSLAWEGCELSMGMSDDYPLALEYGSTMIRVGSRIFGERK